MFVQTKKNRSRLQTNEAAEVAILAAHNPHISSRYRGILIFQKQIFYSETPLISFTFHYIQELGMIMLIGWNFVNGCNSWRSMNSFSIRRYLLMNRLLLIMDN